MGVIKEWTCSDCGNEFDSDLPCCSNCGSENVQRAFRTAPGFKGDKTKMKDSSLREFTNQYGLSDFSNNQNTKHEKKTSHEWKPVSDLVSDPNVRGGESKLIKDLSPTAKQSVRNAKVLNPRLQAVSR